MTAQEKANKIISKLYINGLDFNANALLIVDEIINANPHSNPLNTESKSTMDFWMQVKQEIKNHKK